MFYCTNSYGTVFSVEVLEKRVNARLSTSDKDQNGEYKNSYWNAVFVGGAFEKAKTLTDKDRIHINKCKITNETYKNKDGENRSWLKVTIFDFEKLGDSGNAAPVEKESKPKKPKTSKTKSIQEIMDDDSDDGLPF